MEQEPGVDGLEHAQLQDGEVEAGEKKTRPRPPRPGKCRKFTRDEMARALPDIVKKFVEEAKAGSVAHTRLLTSLSGIDKEPIAVPKPRRTKGMVALLIESLERDFPERKQTDGDGAVN